MDPISFVEARIEELELAELGDQESPLISLFKMIVYLEKQWPILVQSPISFDPPVRQDGINGVATEIYFSVEQKIAFLTRDEFVARFGMEGPFSPIFKQMLAGWCDHPDFKGEWL